MSWFSAARARLHLLFSRRAAESRMNDEVGFHLEMETDRLAREEGLPPDEARRRAHVAFGGVTQHTETLREGRGLAWLSGMSLDLRLGFRMLMKYPGLTAVGGVAMAFAIWVGAVTFEMVSTVFYPSLPLPGGDRIVQLRNWDVELSQEEPRALHDFIIWRQALSSVTDLGAYQDVTRNLIVTPGDARPVQVAEITASAFRVASGKPLMGRMLIEADERPGAPPVMVIGYDVWQRRFGGDPEVIGRSVQLGTTFATVVGVMPEGFAFPVAHAVWTPFRPGILDGAPRAGPPINVFGRLAPGATLDEARAQLATIGRRAATEFPATHEHLQPQVAGYVDPFDDTADSDILLSLSIPVFGLMLLVLVCGNVALLLFARAASRETELIVRSALGASRGRIVAQLFAEALVLGVVASVVGLAAADFGLRRWGVEFLQMNYETLPFWYDLSLSASTVLWVIVLTLVGAVIAGVLPALKVTRGLGSRLRQGTAGGGLRFGGIWTAVIVAQVAVTVAFPAIVYMEQGQLRQIRDFDPGFAAAEFLGVELEMEEPPVPGAGADEAARNEAHRLRFAASLEEMRERVAAAPGVTGVTFVDRLPRVDHAETEIELEDPSAVAAGAGQEAPVQRYPGDITTARIDPSYFDVLERPVITGRAFHAGDLAPDARVVIVDQGFVDQVLLGRNALGRRIRFVDDGPGDASAAKPVQPWYQIVGIAKELGMGSPTRTGRAAGLYLPAAPGDFIPANMLVHVRGDPMAIGGRVREIATAVDPTLRLTEMQRLDQVSDTILWIIGLWLKITLVLTAIALLLSLAGIYAVLSFTVARRTREIGVRVALGASPRRVVTAIFRRPLTQVALGVVAGTALVAFGVLVSSVHVPDQPINFAEATVSPKQAAMLVAYAGLMFAVCLLACIVPTRRALGVEPTVAMREE